MGEESRQRKGPIIIILFFEILFFKKWKKVFWDIVCLVVDSIAKKKGAQRERRWGGNGHYSRNFAWDVLRKKILSRFIFLSLPFCVCVPVAMQV